MGVIDRLITLMTVIVIGVIAYFLTRAFTKASSIGEAIGEGSSDAVDFIKDKVGNIGDFTNRLAGAGWRNWTKEIRTVATSAKIRPSLIAAIVQQESNGNPDAQGKSNDVGLMQITQPALQDYNENYAGQDFKLDDLIGKENGINNLIVGTLFYKLQLKRMGNEFDALRAYNGGAKGASLNPNLSKDYANNVTEIDMIISSNNLI